MESVPVKEPAGGHAIWTGVVEVFELVGFSAAKRCYAWVETFGKTQQQFVTVLQKGLVISPESAVRAWLASKTVTIHPVFKTN